VITRDQVAVADWVGALSRLHADGLIYLDFIAATSRLDGGTDVVAHVMTPDASLRVLVSTVVGDEEVLESLTALYPIAAWQEREAAELTGVVVRGHPDLRALTLPEGSPAVMRRDFVLTPRVDTPWPGLAEPGVDPDSNRRRRVRTVPGVPAHWLAQPGQEDSP